MWSERASCKDHPLNLWFGSDAGKKELADAICKECPVQDECLEDALAGSPTNDHGRRAGTSERERIRIRKSRRR